MNARRRKGNATLDCGAACTFLAVKYENLARRSEGREGLKGLKAGYATNI
jgi:hypothetical protein